MCHGSALKPVKRSLPDGYETTKPYYPDPDHKPGTSLVQVVYSGPDAEYK